MAKRVGSVEENVVWVAGLGVGAYFLFKHFFPGAPSQADSNAVNNVFTTPGTDNPFSYQYKYGLYAQNPGYYNQSYWNNLGSLVSQAQQSGTPIANIGGAANYILYGEEIRSAFGLLTIDYNTIQSVFQLFNSQADVANTAAYLYFGHNIDLYQLLANATGSAITVTGGLSTTQLAQIVNQVNNLPVSN